MGNFILHFHLDNWSDLLFESFEKNELITFN